MRIVEALTHSAFDANRRATERAVVALAMASAPKLIAGARLRAFRVGHHGAGA